MSKVYLSTIYKRKWTIVLVGIAYKIVANYYSILQFDFLDSLINGLFGTAIYDLLVSKDKDKEIDRVSDEKSRAQGYFLNNKVSSKKIIKATKKKNRKEKTKKRIGR